MAPHPLCKLLGHELSYVTSGEKITTEKLTDTCQTIGLLFAEDEISQETSTDLKILLESLTQLHEQLKKRSVSFEVILLPVKNTSIQIQKESKCGISQFLSGQSCPSPILTICSKNAPKIQEYIIRKYKVQQTPSFILIHSASTEVITYEGKDKLLNDPKGLQFPWKYPTFSEILSGASAKLVRHNRAINPEEDNVELLEGLKMKEVEQKEWRSTIKGLLFAAYWCPPCRSFIAALNELYDCVNKDEKKFEIIFISSDRSNQSFQRFFSTMPWLAVPYDDDKFRNLLMQTCNVKAIPSLTILDGNDEVITMDGRLEVNDDLEGIEFPWYPRLVDELRDRHSAVVNNALCVIYFTDDTEADYDKAEVLLSPIAIEVAASDMEEALEPKFFIAADSDLAESLRIFMDLEETKSHLVITDVSNFRYAVENRENVITEKSIRDFLREFQSNKLKYKSIQTRFI